MASYTTNLNLKKPDGSENVAIGDINNNMDAIDTAYGTLNSKIANIGTVLTNAATKNAVECPNNGESTVIGTITLSKGTWIIILGGWGPLGATTSNATSIQTGYPIMNSTNCTRLFNLTAYAKITNSSETFNITVTNWESSSITSVSGYNVYAIKVSE